MEYNIVYKSSVRKDPGKIDKGQLLKILNKIESVLKSTSLKGKILTGEFKGLTSYRIGDYRVIYTILGSTVLILKISHRKDVYK